MAVAEYFSRMPPPPDALHLREYGEFGLTRRTPGCPEVYDGRLIGGADDFRVIVRCGQSYSRQAWLLNLRGQHLSSAIDEDAQAVHKTSGAG
jgi:hypothetical protein